MSTPLEVIQANGVVTRPPTYEILSEYCLSSNHRADIDGVIDGGCQCGNCKVKVRQHRYHKGAFIGETSKHDYVFDTEEVQEALIKRYEYECLSQRSCPLHNVQHASE